MPSRYILPEFDLRLSLSYDHESCCKLMLTRDFTLVLCANVDLYVARRLTPASLISAFISPARIHSIGTPVLKGLGRIVLEISSAW